MLRPIIYLIIILFCNKLFALEGLDRNDPKIAELEAFLKKVKDAKDAKNHPYYQFLREEEIRNDRSCVHCPKYLLLTEEVNKVVEKMNQDPKYANNNELPVRINKLKFLFYTQALRQADGSIECKRFHDITPDLKPTKFDGQFKLVAEDVLKFSQVTEIQYLDPKAVETVYYYRGEGMERNLIVQAILTKEGGKFRYFRYYPSMHEENPYNLPDLDKRYPDSRGNQFLAQFPEEKEDNNSKDKANPESYSIKFKTEVEKRGKWIPKNVHFVEAKMDQELFGDYKLKGSSDTSLKGNEANLTLKNDKSELAKVSLHTKLNGETEHKITIPYSVRVFDSQGLTAKGEIGKESQGSIVKMSLTDEVQEYIRAEIKQNSLTNRTTYVLAKDFRNDKNEFWSVNYGKGEDDLRYASLKHTKSIKNNTSMVLDVKVNENRQISFVYQYERRF